MPEQMRQHRLLCSHQLLSCLVSLMKPIPPKQSEEIKCPIYFGLQEMWTPAFLGVLGKTSNQSSSFLNFPHKTLQSDRKTCSLQHPPAEQSLLPRKGQKLLAYKASRLQHPAGRGTPLPCGQPPPRRREPPVPVPAPPAVCRGGSAACSAGALP